MSNDMWVYIEKARHNDGPVSYTHLDVYKRQTQVGEQTLGFCAIARASL